MKNRRRFLAAGAAVAGTFAATRANAQKASSGPAKHKVVFELNAPAPSGWDQLFHNMEASDKGIVLAACQNSMRAMRVTTEDLFPFAAQVDSGVAELVRKQEAGWSYIKGGE